MLFCLHFKGDIQHCFIFTVYNLHHAKFQLKVLLIINRLPCGLNFLYCLSTFLVRNSRWNHLSCTSLIVSKHTLSMMQLSDVCVVQIGLNIFLFSNLIKLASLILPVSRGQYRTREQTDTVQGSCNDKKLMFLSGSNLAYSERQRTEGNALTNFNFDSWQ